MGKKPKVDLVIENAAELCTFASDGKLLVGKNAGNIGIVKNGFVAVQNGRILAAGPKSILSKFSVGDAEHGLYIVSARYRNGTLEGYSVQPVE